MLDLKVNNKEFGATEQMQRRPNGLIQQHYYHGVIESEFELDRVDLILDGRIFNSWTPQGVRNNAGHFVTPIESPVMHEESCWFAIRCFEKLPTGRVRFAHSAPTFVEYQESAIRPRRDQVRYLIQRCEEELARNKDVLSEAELAEYREALEFYRRQFVTAR